MRLLDLFCGAGGAAMGYYRAGFEVVGVDIEDRPTYPFEFWRMNALHLDYEKLALFDVIHASPPCQQYSKSTALARRRGKTYPDLYQPVKAMLVAAGKPYVIENVMGSPVRGIGLCGTMFGLGVFRHRVFESNIPLKLPENRCLCSQRRIGKGYVTVAGDSCTKLEALGALGIHWRMSKDEVTEAIPPAFTEFIGRQLHEKLLLINDENRVLIEVRQ
ncbi:MAG: DNA cytosine methyltransferase [Anaerolineae bacterium]|nr:DNA cytosine methyltransferase [Anaerolineae bacterium]